MGAARIAFTGCCTGGRGSASDDARNAAEIVEHTLGRVLPCILGALGALHTFSKSPVSLGAADQASVLRNSGSRSNDSDEGDDKSGAYFHAESHQHHAADECDSVMQRVRGQVCQSCEDLEMVPPLIKMDIVLTYPTSLRVVVVVFAPLCRFTRCQWCSSAVCTDWFALTPGCRYLGESCQPPRSACCSKFCSRPFDIIT